MYRNKRYKKGKRNNHQNGNGFRGRGQGGFRIKSFDPSQMVSSIHEPNNQTPEEKYEAQHAFDDFLISDRLKNSIKARGYIIPTPIQDKTIPEILNGKDVVGIANTGTGKTAAFLIPLIDKVLKNPNSRVLIIAPTRELAVQIDKELQLFTNSQNISSVICIGGVNIRPQINRLYKNPSFVIGTPGRLLDLFNQRKLDFGKFESIVLDEVDRMLDMGFITDVKKIISMLPHKRQSLFFSATLDDNTKSVMSSFINNPVLISVKSKDTISNINQKIVKVLGRDKTKVLSEILDGREVEKTLVFVRTKRIADTLKKNLAYTGFKCAVMHGNKSQSQRQRSLSEFKEGKINVLIATDVASRGIDVNNITHVINYDLPESREVYIHRIGRTGRANKKGVALTFVS